MMKLAVALAALTAGVFAAADGGHMLRIVSYNIHHAEGTDGVVDLERIARVILALEPDIVCLQEVDQAMPRTGRVDMPKELGALLEMQPVYGPNLIRDDARYGNLTLSRLPVREHENVALPHGGDENREPRGALRVRLDTGSSLLDVWNTHWGLVPEERAAQGAAMATAIRESMDASTLAAGDFNEGAGAGVSAVAEVLKRAPMDPEGSYPASNPNKLIDLIWYGPGLATSGAGISRLADAAVASDHLPVWADIVLPGTGAGGERPNEDRSSDALTVIVSEP